MRYTVRLVLGDRKVAVVPSDPSSALFSESLQRTP